MTLSRRRFLGSAVATSALFAATASGYGQGYPARPVRIVVGFAPGGFADINARLIGQWLSDRFGQPFVIENRPGAGANLATETVVRAPADGYTLLLANSSDMINATLYRNLSFNFIRDIAPVTAISRVPYIMAVNSAVPAKSVPEFIAYAKANPGKVNMASAGTGAASHLAGELFKMMAGVELVHVPYRGQAPALTDLLGGQVQMMFIPATGTIDAITTGKLRALAVTTAARSEALPGVASMAEFVPGYESSGWNGICAPGNTPPDIVEKLNEAIVAGLADPKIKARIAELGGEPLPMTPAEFARFIADDTEKWAKVVRFSGAKAD
jgi:tripartite-type tricarboxylate transporter receptor subunit TctC